MTVIDQTAPAQTQDIAFELDLQHPPEKVWRALTEPALLAQWLLPVSEGSLAPGAAFLFKTQPYPGWDGTVACRVLERDEPRRLSYSWTVAGMQLDTVVTFTLVPSDAGTRLSLVQSGFRPEQKQNFAGARYGWKMMGGKLAELLDQTS
jgi:uncharacterized protein YndB with AHSA1/START domain